MLSTEDDRGSFVEIEGSSFGREVICFDIMSLLFDQLNSISEAKARAIKAQLQR